MTGNLVEERSGAETIADVIDALCVKRAEWERIAAEYQQERDEERLRIEQIRADERRTRDERDRLRGELDKRCQELDDAEHRAARDAMKLTVRDGQITELGLYIVELIGFRDTAKTKAERVMLGHVVERLRNVMGTGEDD